MCDVLDRIEEKGAMKSKIEIACRMLKANLDVNQIAEFTDLPISKVIELKSEIPVQK